MTDSAAGSIRARTAMAVLSDLDTGGVTHCVLRNHEQIPTEPGRDIDLIARDLALSDVESILVPIAEREGWDRILKCEGHHEGTSYYLLKRIPSGVQQLEFHFTRVRWAGIAILTQNEILARRQRASNGLWVADPTQVVLQRLLQFGLSGQLEDMKDEYWVATRAQVAAATDEVSSSLATLIGERHVESLIQAVEDDDQPGASTLIKGLRARFVLRGSVRAPQSVPGAVRKNLARVTERWRPPRCGVVGLVPDTRLVVQLERAIAPMFVKVKVVRLDRLEPTNRRSLATTVNRVGAALLVGDDESRGLELDRWGQTAVRVPDTDIDSAIDVIVDRFAANHTSIS